MDRPAADERPEPLANVGRKNALKILERRAAKDRIVRMQAPIRHLKRRGRKYEGQQREDVCEALVGAVLEELVDERGAVLLLDLIEQPLAFPYRAANGDLAPNRVGPVRASASRCGRRADGDVVRVEVRDLGVDRVTAVAVATACS